MSDDPQRSSEAATDAPSIAGDTHHGIVLAHSSHLTLGYVSNRFVCECTFILPCETVYYFKYTLTFYTKAQPFFKSQFVAFRLSHPCAFMGMVA